MTLHDTIIADATSVFCNANDFAEPVIYHGRNGTARTINAVVVREALMQLQDSEAIIPLYEVHVANSSTTGISSNELNLGGDQLEFADRVGGPTKLRLINRLTSHDEGMLVLECR